jgi:hypothetical protein
MKKFTNDNNLTELINKDNQPDSQDKKEEKEMEYFNCNGKDIQEEGLKPEKWMLDALAMNPDFCQWSPYQGYMDNESEKWDGRLIFKNWSELKKGFRPWVLDEYNEIINFHFEVHRKSPGTNRCNLSITLWIFHPMRGCSRGIYVKAIQKIELDNVATTLKLADQKNRKKFSKLY